MAGALHVRPGIERNNNTSSSTHVLLLLLLLLLSLLPQLLLLLLPAGEINLQGLVCEVDTPR
jgi:hypothetical protein